MSGYLALTRFLNIENAAESLLVEYRKDFFSAPELPIPVEKIAQYHLGLYCELVSLKRLGKRTAGLLDPAKKVIYIDEESSLNQYNFTIAHEIGHWILHARRKTEITERVFQRNSSSGRKLKQRIGNDQAEVDANRFAGALLLPHKLLFSRLVKEDEINEKAVIGIAKEFGTSLSSVIYRIFYLHDYRYLDSININRFSIYQLQSSIKNATV